MVLNDAEAAVCAAILSGSEAWSRWEDLEARHGGDVLDRLVLRRIVEAWIRPDFVALTLTPWGADRLGVHLEERWQAATEETVERDPSRPAAPGTVRRERVLLEIPVWRTGDGGRPLRLPRHGRLGCTLVREPEAPAPAEDDGPELLTDAEGLPVLLFAGGGADEPGLYRAKGERRGVTVAVAGRLRGKGA